MDNYNYDFFGQCEASAPDFTLTTFDGEKQLIGTCRGARKATGRGQTEEMILLKNPLAFEFESEEAIFC
jgi:hypothetical protein